eukprot:1159386-Pelagomonas_calceolata.AAC.5
MVPRRGAHKQEGPARPPKPPLCPLSVMVDAWVISISFDAAGCHAGCQGGAAELRKIPRAIFSQESRPPPSALLLAGLGAPPKTAPCQLAAGGHLGTQGVS